MSALDDLVQALQATVSSVESAHSDGAHSEATAGEASQAAAAFGRDEDVARVEALRGDIDSANGALAQLKDTYGELLQQAVALQGGG